MVYLALLERIRFPNGVLSREIKLIFFWRLLVVLYRYICPFSLWRRFHIKCSAYSGRFFNFVYMIQVNVILINFIIILEKKYIEVRLTKNT